MLDFIQSAGFGIYPVLAFGFAAVAFAFKFYQQPSDKRAATAKWLMALTVGAGVLALSTGVQRSAAAMPTTDDKWIFLLGLNESLNNLLAAGVLVMIAMLVMLVGQARQTPSPARS